MSKLLSSLLALPLLLAACRTLGPEPSDPKPVATNAPPPAPRIQPLDTSVGRVVTVNARLRFVILDFSLSALPSPGQRLVLERDGADVGELKVTGPARDATTAADIIRGEPKVGDRVRPKRD